MQLQEIILLPTTRVQDTVMKNVQDIRQLNEKRVREDYLRFVINRLVYLHFLRCKCSIV